MTTAASASSVPNFSASTDATSAPARPWYIVGALFDRLVFIGSPLLAFAFVALVASPRAPGGSIAYTGATPPWLILMAALFTFGHVNLTVVRSHINPTVYRRYRRRMMLAPALLLLALALSSEVLFVIAPIAVLWDEWHSVMQTFGFGRIYDSKRGNDPHVGRRLDMGMCFTFEWLPYLVALTFVRPAEFIPATGFDPSLAWLHVVADKAAFLRWPLIIGGLAYAVFYVVSYLRLGARGYRIAPAKLALYTTTGAANILALSYYSILDGAIIGNLYHASMYVALVWFSERKNLTTSFSLDRWRFGALATFVVVVGSAGALAWLRLETMQISWLIAFWLMTSLAHFWFDSFIWSVRRQEV
ncbi:MAG: hypothetical protein H6746_01725 [Deltaproteobacteria bacterium]|nr:hypothetical protein [Deltaproteobacteria bacterium]